MDLYLIIVVVLFILAVSDLTVGVANDAVNFLNSAIGSKTAPYKVVLTIASLGVFVGVLFSSGMMEVARKGIFNPEMFLFPEVMMIFLAVMLTDVLLLDLFNTYGLPTSTTVSLVFGLIGAAVGMSIIKISASGESIANLLEYINTAKALAIIFGILISVVISFTFGSLIQYFVRLIFTFDYEKKIKRYGGLWGGFALTFITYFIVVKGAKGATFLSESDIQWIQTHTLTIMGYSFVFWGVLLQILALFTKINILKVVVLMGTFALALSFSANDLVNFIGVPLAGYSSFLFAYGNPNFGSLTMEVLHEPVHINNIFLVGSGVVMMLTLWISKKSRTVIKTEVNLGRQGEGFERFESSTLSRQVVRMTVSVIELVKKITPVSLHKLINKRFDLNAAVVKTLPGEAPPAFDLIRASVTLMVSAVLISFGTSLKLPLSTTYVTFMVAMGTSLSDRSWGRESAVYRVNGVLTVIGGWFFTALLASLVAGIFVTVLYFGQLYAVIALVLLGLYSVYSTHIIHKRREKDESDYESATKIDETASSNELYKSNALEMVKLIEGTGKIIKDCMKGLIEGDRTQLKSTIKESRQLGKYVNLLMSNLFKEVRILKEDEIKEERRYGKLVASLKGISANLKALNTRCYDHIDNNHSVPGKAQTEDLKELRQFMEDLFKAESECMASEKDLKSYKMEEKLVELRKIIQKLDKQQVDRIKKSTDSTRNSLLFLEIISDCENIITHSFNLTNAIKTNLLASGVSEDNSNGDEKN
ncbi:MAG: anion permease [Ignavibacteriaceae bacterium]